MRAFSAIEPATIRYAHVAGSSKTQENEMTPAGAGVISLAPEAGLEPATKRLTVARSTTELLRNISILASRRATPERHGTKCTK
jgi:hypothetical protein